MEKIKYAVIPLICLSSSAFAENPASPAGALGGFVPIILIFLIFYVLLIRPQQKQVKEHKTMLNALKKGDIVTTSGGLIGTIEELRENELTLKISDNCRAKFTRSCISGVVTGNSR